MSLNLGDGCHVADILLFYYFSFHFILYICIYFFQYSNIVDNFVFSQNILSSILSRLRSLAKGKDFKQISNNNTPFYEGTEYHQPI